MMGRWLEEQPPTEDVVVVVDPDCLFVGKVYNFLASSQSGRGATRAEDAQGTTYLESHITEYTGIRRKSPHRLLLLKTSWHIARLLR